MLFYAVDTLWHGLPAGTVAVNEKFDGLLGSAPRMGTFHAVFLVAVALVVARGVQRGASRPV